MDFVCRRSGLMVVYGRGQVWTHPGPNRVWLSSGQNLDGRGVIHKDPKEEEEEEVPMAVVGRRKD